MAIIDAPLKQVIYLHMDTPNEPIPDGFAVCDGSTLGPTAQDITPGGSYTLPNLLNVFIVGADPSKSVGQSGVIAASGNINLPGGAPGPQGTGGSNNYILGTSEMPIHTHAGAPSGSATVNLVDPGHTHTVTDSGHSHVLSDPGHGHVGTSDTVGSHIHTLNDSGHAHTYTKTNIQTGGPGSSELFNPGSQSSTATSTQTTGITVNAAGSHSHTISLGSSKTNATVASASAGISIASASANISGQISGLTLSISNAGGGAAFDNRPHYYGLVPIMRVKA